VFERLGEKPSEEQVSGFVTQLAKSLKDRLGKRLDLPQSGFGLQVQAYRIKQGRVSTDEYEQTRAKVRDAGWISARPVEPARPPSPRPSTSGLQGYRIPKLSERKEKKERFQPPSPSKDPRVRDVQKYKEASRRAPKLDVGFRPGGELDSDEELKQINEDPYVWYDSDYSEPDDDDPEFRRARRSRRNKKGKGKRSGSGPK
jgi:hypothetical protein